MEKRRLGSIEVSPIGMGCMAQIALAWMLRKQPNVVPIPGSRNQDRIMENLGAWDIVLSDAEFVALERAIDRLYGRKKDSSTSEATESVTGGLLLVERQHQGRSAVHRPETRGR